jgi:predicted transcriptional regulator
VAEEPEPQPEPWLRGVLEQFDPVSGHLLRSSQQIREDARRAVKLGARGFHLKHLAGSTDRLCAYAEGRELSDTELAALDLEHDDDQPPESLMAAVDVAFDRYDEIVRATHPKDFYAIRHVGRKKLPVTLIGLLIHIAEHGQRHAGQAITTAKLTKPSLDWVRGRMEIHFTPEQEAWISRSASRAGMDSERFVMESVLRAIEESNHFSAAVRKGIEQADRGEFVDDDDVRAWLEQREQRI